jgi:dipeptidyl aminopeptidase/acylaminoacyl peptidase
MAESLIQNILNLVIPCKPKISPDGRRVVYGTRRKWNHRIDGHSTASLWIADTSAEKTACPLTDDSFLLRDLKWSPDGDMVVFISDFGKPGKSSTIYGVDPDRGRDQIPRAITPAENEKRIVKYDFSPDGKFIAFLACAEKSVGDMEEAKDDPVVWGQENWDFTSLWLVTLATREVQSIFKEACQVVDFTWSPGGTEIALVTHRTPHIESKYLHGADIATLDVQTRHVRKICHMPGGGTWDLMDLTWVGSTVYFISYNDLRSDCYGHAVYAVKTSGSSTDKAPFGEFSKANHVVEWNGCPNGLTKAGDQVIVYFQRGTEDQLRSIDDGRVLLSQQKRIVDFDIHCNGKSDGMVMAILSGDVNTPTEAFFVDAKGNNIQLSDHGTEAGFSGKKFGNCQFLTCPTLDGHETLDGVYLSPAHLAGPDGRPAKPLPTFVLLHGGPYSRYIDSFDEWHPMHMINPVFLSEGFAVLMPNYRGSSGRGRTFAGYANSGVGRFDEPDVVAMTQHAVASGLADPSRLVGGGWSQGGHLAYLSAVRNGFHGFGWKFCGAIAGAGITDWGALTLESDVGFSQAKQAWRAPWQTRYDMPGELEVAMRGSALWEFGDAVKNRRIPDMLMLHGEKDARIPISQAIGFRRAMDEAGLPFEFVTYPREGHAFTERKHVEDLMARIVRFLKKHLSGAESG